MRAAPIHHPGPTTGWLSYWIGRAWMAAFGWRIEGNVPPVSKAVVIAAPHTSNWDLPHMLAASFVFRIKVSWLGKHTLFRPPLGGFFRCLGGVPVDRRAPQGLVSQAADRIAQSERLFLAVPPSGTRKRRPYWKSGFYWIAYTAQVPIVCGYLDFERKRAALGMHFVPTGDVRADMERIRAFYRDVKGRFPALQTRIRLKEEDEEETAVSR